MSADGSNYPHPQWPFDNPLLLPVVGEPSADIHAEAAERQQKQRQSAPRLTRRPVMDALEKSRSPGDERISRHSLKNGADRDPDQRLPTAAHLPERFPEAEVRCLAATDLHEPAPQRLANAVYQRNKQEPRQSHQQEGDA